MNLKQEWYRNEFRNHEIIEPHRIIENEFTFYDAIASGNIDYVNNNVENETFTDPDGMGVLSENPLQNLRYHFVVTTAMITRYCVHAGMEQEKAYSLSDFYILKMDRCRKLEDISALHTLMCKDFCKKMNYIKLRNPLSKPVVLCIDYIYGHLHERITIKELAKYLQISESYLSNLFRKEMGIPVSQYILELKIEKAQNLLQFSNYKIVEIANYLSFSSQSHFIQIFQKKVGITPHKYRTQHFRSSWKQANTLK